MIYKLLEYFSRYKSDPYSVTPTDDILVYSTVDVYPLEFYDRKQHLLSNTPYVSIPTAHIKNTKAKNSKSSSVMLENFPCFVASHRPQYGTQFPRSDSSETHLQSDPSRE